MLKPLNKSVNVIHPTLFKFRPQTNYISLLQNVLRVIHPSQQRDVTGEAARHLISHVGHFDFKHVACLFIYSKAKALVFEYCNSVNLLRKQQIWSHELHIFLEKGSLLILKFTKNIQLEKILLRLENSHFIRTEILSRSLYLEAMNLEIRAVEQRKI